MINLIKIEWLKLRTTAGLYVTALAALVLSVGASITNVLVKPGQGDPPIGSAANAQDVLSQAGCGRFPGDLHPRHPGRRRRVPTPDHHGCVPRRTSAVPGHRREDGDDGRRRRGTRCRHLHHHDGHGGLGCIRPRGSIICRSAWSSLGLGTTLSGACYGLLGVAVGALARNTVAAVIGGIVWIQVVEVAVLENAAPSIAKWLPVGAARGLTAVGSSLHVLSRPISATVLVVWATGLVLLAGALSTRRELR